MQWQNDAHDIFRNQTSDASSHLLNNIKISGQTKRIVLHNLFAKIWKSARSHINTHPHPQIPHRMHLHLTTSHDVYTTLQHHTVTKRYTQTFSTTHTSLHPLNNIKVSRQIKHIVFLQKSENLPDHISTPTRTPHPHNPHTLTSTPGSGKTMHTIFFKTR